MFSKITPNEVAITGDTSNGGTLERSTDLKNWEEVDDSILSEGERTTFTNSTDNADILYYRVRQLPGLP